MLVIKMNKIVHISWDCESLYCQGIRIGICLGIQMFLKEYERL